MLFVKHMRVDLESGSFPFFVVTVEDGTQYQIKLPNYETTSMLNEYIAHQIADNVSCRVPKGDFILFTDEDVEFGLDQILESSHQSKIIYQDYNLSQIKNEDGQIILFGIEFMLDKVIIPEDVDEFYYYLESSSVDNEFYSLYSYDLFLHNHDRHCKNLMFRTEDGETYVSLLIDHDRIFGTNAGIERLSELKEDFDCIKGPMNSFLYSMITTDEQKNLIHIYSKDIESLKTITLKNIFDSFLNNCHPSILEHKDVKDEIINFLEFRKNGIVDAIEGNYETCYG